MIKGADLYLNVLKKEDLEDRFQWLNDYGITKYFTVLGTIPLSYESILQWYQKITGNSQEIHFSIFLNNGLHIGGAQLKSIDWKNRTAEFGMFIGNKEYWKKGLGTQVTRLLVKYGFQSLNLHRIWLRVDLENIAAIRCYEKSGFLREGIFRQEVFRDGTYYDSLVMSILENEWRA